MKQTFGKYESCSEVTSGILMDASSKYLPFQVLLCSELSFIHSSEGNKIQTFTEGQWLMELLSCFSAVPFHTTLCLRLA